MKVGLRARSLAEIPSGPVAGRGAVIQFARADCRLKCRGGDKLVVFQSLVPTAKVLNGCVDVVFVYGEDKIYTTIEDLCRWEQALENNQLVTAATFQTAISPGKLNDGSPTRYGFGWNLGERAGSKAHFHAGSWLGYRTAIMRIPEPRLTIVVL